MKKYIFNLQYPKPLKESDLDDLNRIALSGCFSRYSSDYVIQLERDLAKYYETEYAVTCTSGTAALHGALVALDLPPGSEIILTPVADIGIVLPVIYENLIPVFGDIDSETYNMSLESIKSKVTKKTKAVIAVHLAGSPSAIEEISNFCKSERLFLLEDFSQAHGAKYKDSKVGSFGDISYGSYQQSKQITCGEGGVIVTNSEKLQKRAFIGVDKGWQRHLPLEDRFYEFLAPNVRFNAIQAAVLKPQIKGLDKLIQRKRERAVILENIFSEYQSVIKILKVLPDSYSSYYSFPIFLTSSQNRNILLENLREEFNLVCAYGYANPKPLYQCVNALINPKKYGKSFAYENRSYELGTSPKAEDLLSRSFLIPFNENYSLSETEEIGLRVTNAIDKLKFK